MNLVELIESDKLRYHEFVAYHPHASFLQAWEWGEWQKRLGKNVKRFIVSNEQQETLLAAQVIIQALGLLKSTYLFIPYGPIIAADQSSQEQETVLRFFIE